jgi:iron uptake system EfeUOB component EfeO/EfeM
MARVKGLKKILEELKDNLYTDDKGMCEAIDLAHQQILALIPKKKEMLSMATDYRYSDRTPYFIQGFNQAISEIEHSMTGER